MKTLRDKLKTDLVLSDGAFGTYAQSLGLRDVDFKDKLGCMEYLSITRPDLVNKIHSDYLEAGSDAIQTNTFGGNAIKLAEYGLSDDMYEINLTAAKLARSARDAFSTSGWPRYVIGTMGPTGKLPSSTDPAFGNVTYSQLQKVYYDQALGIIDGAADAILVETGQDLLEMKAAIRGVQEALKERTRDLVVMAQCTLVNNGRMLLGTEMSAVVTTLGYLDVDVIGLNCSTGPVEMEEALRFLTKNSPAFISCVPNAGLPVETDGRTVYPLAPGQMAKIMARFVKKYHVDVVGGCCGTNPDHILKMRKSLKCNKRGEKPINHHYASFYNAFDLEKMKRPIKVGERINAQGSRKMKTFLENEDYDSIIELGKQQQRTGAEILDVCSVLTERSTEKKDSVIITRRLAESVEIPLMIDSTNAEVIEAALESYPGTAFINSVNLEDGGEKAKRIFKLAKDHAGFVVNLVIDEQGMAKTVEHKLEVMKRLYSLAVNGYNLAPHRLIFDMLTFALTTGDSEYTASAVNTYEAIKRVKQEYPGVLTVLGVSNVSFGLSKEARKVLNMVFLHHALRSGLDMAIVNPSEFIEYKDIPSKERKRAEDIIFNKRPDALNRFIECFIESIIGVRPPHSTFSKKNVKCGGLTPEETAEKLKVCIFDRDKINIIPLVDEAIKTYSPEHVINHILMDAMQQVGQKLDQAEVPLPYVLQSAEVMRKAIEYLEKYLPKEKTAGRGKVLIATVFGDVHDIGKNLVKILLEHNGFSVIDLGKQVPVEKIIEEAKRNNVDAVGLSALLVSTARHMKTCVQSMHDAGLEFPILIGGAPINKKFAKDISSLQDSNIYSGGVFYAKDAFAGLKIMQTLIDPTKKKEAMDAYYRQFGEQDIKDQRRETKDEKREMRDEGRGTKDARPKPPFYGVKSFSNIPIDEVFTYLDEEMLFSLAWGAKLKDKKEKTRLIEDEYKPLLKELKEESIHKRWLDLKAVYGYFKCHVVAEDMDVLDESGKVLEKIHFSRSEKGKKISISDYFSTEPAEYDVVAFQAVTVGDKINDTIRHLNETKEFTRAFFLHGLSVSLAEALTAYTHHRIRCELGLKKNQGQRYSPGYPLWQRIEDQEKLFRLLDVEKRLGVRLTEGYQMVPEQSTTAMIVYNDKAEY